MRAESVFGFEGDEDQIRKSILRGKLCAIYAYAIDLRQNAVERLFLGDGPSLDTERMFAVPLPEVEPGEADTVV